MYFINPFQDKYALMSSDNRYTSFTQFNYRTTTVPFAKVSPRKKEFLKKVLRNGWEMDASDRMLRIAAGWGAATKNYRAESGGRAYLLKEGHPSSPTLRDLSNQFLYFCEMEGAKVPHVLLTTRGLTYYGVKCIISLYDFIEGEHFDGGRGELREVATRLAQLDKILANAPLGAQLLQERSTRKYNDHKNAKSFFWGIRSRGARGEFEEEFLSALPYLEEKSASHAAANPGQLPRQPIHCNVHPHNLLFSTEGKLLAFLDFESLVHSQRAREVAFAMHRLARAYGEGTERNEDAGADIRERAKEFLSYYNSENPLQDSEMRALRFILEDEALRRVIAVLKNHYFREDFHKDMYFRKRLTMLQETELFDFL
jgi:Ser/Thr protein kinase RdoA (MazF antagonist)